MPHRTRVKICGLTRTEDVRAAAEAGADAIGLVFYPPSPRYVTPQQAATLMAAIPPFVTSVGLFVNASDEELLSALEVAPVSLLQFHGDETPERCAHLARLANRPFLRAARVKSDMSADDLLKYARSYRQASALCQGLLLDAFAEGYGGAGKAFDWSVIPAELAPAIVLSGGLNAENAFEAVARVRPFAVDVSSGVEAAKGIKDAGRILSFIGAVRQADAVPHSREIV